MATIIEVTTTTETEEQSQLLARVLIESRVAACVQVTGPIQSFYRWNGKVCESQEYRCTAKSTNQMLPRLMEVILQSHAYEVPEILVTEVAASSPSYSDWLHQQLQPTTD